MSGRAHVDGSVQWRWLVERQDCIHDALDGVIVEFLSDAGRQAVYNELQRNLFSMRKSILEPEDEGLNFTWLTAQIGSL